VKPADVVGGAHTVCLAHVEPETVEWLWPGRLPIGKLIVLAGDPGLGKSYATLDIAARVSRGAQWPDTHDRTSRGSVLLLTAEDDLQDTIRPRLDAAGADPKYVQAIRATPAGDGRDRAVDLRHDIEALRQTLRTMVQPRLLVIDPISSYLGDTDSHNNADVRNTLQPLADLAAEFRIAVLAVSHLNKSSGTNATHRVTGSLAFTAAARAVWLVAPDSEDRQRRLFVPAKMNLAPDSSGLGYRLHSDNHGAVAKVEWESEPVQMTAHDLMASSDEESSGVDDAAEWLREALKDGAKPARAIKEEARDNGIAERTLRRAKNRARIEAFRSGFGRDGQWFWRLTETQEKSGDAS
jgi:hypothetical protein